MNTDTTDLPHDLTLHTNAGETSSADSADDSIGETAEGALVTTPRMLSVTLTDNERLEYADLLAIAEMDLESVQLGKKASASDWKLREEKATATIRDLTRILHSRKVQRQIDCYEVPFYQRNIMSTYRVDTGELVSERQLTADERQLRMPLDDFEPDEPATARPRDVHPYHPPDSDTPEPASVPDFPNDAPAPIAKTTPSDDESGLTCARCAAVIPLDTLDSRVRVGQGGIEHHSNGVLIVANGDGIYCQDCGDDVAVCRICGCTDEFGCEVGCSWLEPDLCTACAYKPSDESPTEWGHSDSFVVTPFNKPIRVIYTAAPAAAPTSEDVFEYPTERFEFIGLPVDPTGYTLHHVHSAVAGVKATTPYEYASHFAADLYTAQQKSSNKALRRTSPTHPKRKGAIAESVGAPGGDGMDPAAVSEAPA